MSRIAPQLGVCLPVEIQRVIDGDTLVVALHGSAFVWKVRLLDCWAPELPSKTGKESLQFVESYLEQAKDVRLHIPLPSKPHDLLGATTLGRVLGFIWVDGKCLNDEIVQAGYATKVKLRGDT